MTSEPNKYALRTLSKDNLRLLNYTIFINKRNVMFSCYSSDVMNIIKKTNPQEKIKVWFILNSKKVNNKYYTNALLRWVENPRLIEMEKSKKIGLNFNANF